MTDFLTGAALFHFFVVVLLYDVLAASAFGYAIGWIGGKLLLYSEERQLIDKVSDITFAIALAIFVVGAVRIFNADEILAVFMAVDLTQRKHSSHLFILSGLVDAIPNKERLKEESSTGILDLLFTVIFFVFLGLSFPWDGWQELSWRGAVYATLVVLCRRVFFVTMGYPLLRPAVRSLREAVFIGWFGPIAVAATYYAITVIEETHRSTAPTTEVKREADLVWWAVSEVILFSIVIKGLTAMPLTRWISRTDPPADRRMNMEG